jgi:hypothetical protein
MPVPPRQALSLSCRHLRRSGQSLADRRVPLRQAVRLGVPARGGCVVHLPRILGYSDATKSRRYAAVFDTDCFEASMNFGPAAGLRWG